MHALSTGWEHRGACPKSLLYFLFVVRGEGRPVVQAPHSST